MSSWLYLIPHSQGDDLKGALYESCPARIEINKEKLVFGRGSPKAHVDVRLAVLDVDKDVISRRHAELTRSTTSGAYFIRDLGAVNGTFVNSRKIDVHMLQDGDVIQFGGASGIDVGKVIKQNETAVHVKYRFASARQKRKRTTPRTPGSGPSTTGDSVVQRLEMTSPAASDRPPIY